MFERIGTRKRWATRYHSGWQVFDADLGVMDAGLTREEAEKLIAAQDKHIWEIQTGKGKGSYKTRYKFTEPGLHSSRAHLYYRSINTHSGYKKRLLRDGKVVARYIS